MEIERTQKEDRVLIKVKGSTTIENAELLRQELLQGMIDSNALVVDLSQVTGCDVAALQLFFSARLSAQLKEKKFNVINPSCKAMETAARAGLYQEHFRVDLECREVE
jgi:anti-anti-sigma regulatory factor